MITDITPLIITFNEDANLARTLRRLLWAQQILIVDSGSTDATIAILGRYSAVQVIQRRFTTFAEQCNFGLTHIGTPWVLSIDADYVLSLSLIDELIELKPPPNTGGYRARFKYCIDGHPLWGTLYPPRTILYRRARAFYRDEGHGHRVVVEGDIQLLNGMVYHDDRKPLSRWFSSQQSYAKKEAAYVLGSDSHVLDRMDKIRRLVWPAPLFIGIYTLILRGCVLDGWRGWYYVLQRVVAECLIALEIIDQRWKGKGAAGSRQD